jgi:hypothetical protein
MRAFWGSTMSKLVARFTDGSVVKGAALDFAPSKSLFHMTLVSSPVGTPFPIHTDSLKALFYVKDFDGNPEHIDTKVFDSDPPPGAHRIRAAFKDGEVLVGTTTVYRPGLPGFFLKPADSQSNNELCYVFAPATREISFI